jgi:multiple sugar transport system substrate-binding protein
MMKKRLLHLFLAAVMLLPALALGACRSKDEYPPGTEFITLYHWDNGGKTEADVVKKVCKAFEATQDKVGVKVEIIPSYETQMKSVLASRNVPDVFLVPDGNFGQWVTTGALLNLTDRVAASEKIDVGHIWSSAIDRYRFNGKLMGDGDIYALPKDVTPYVMYYNKDLFDRFGVAYPDPVTPWTPEYAATQWKKFGSLSGSGKPKGDHIYGVAKFDPEGLVWSNGGDYLSQDRKEVLIDSPAVIGAYDYLQKSIMEYRTIPDGGTQNPTALFVNGLSACYIAGRSSTADLRTKAQFDWDVAPVPAFDTAPLVNGWSGSVGFSVYAGSPKQDLAYALVEYFASVEGQLVMTEAGYTIPMYNDARTIEKLYEIEAGKKPANTQAFLLAAEHQRAGLWQYLPSLRWKLTIDEGSGVLFKEDASSRATAEEYLTDLKPEIARIIREDFPGLFE